MATLFDERSVPAGFHRVPLAGFAAMRNRLASGVYYLRVATEHDGSETRTVMILR